jgi:hypothetical protein
MIQLSETLKKLRSCGAIVNVDLETENSCFYVADIGQYVIEFHIDYKEQISGYTCYHTNSPEIKDKFDNVEEAIKFCEDMTKRLKALEGKKKA